MSAINNASNAFSSDSPHLNIDSMCTIPLKVQLRFKMTPRYLIPWYKLMASANILMLYFSLQQFFHPNQAWY